MVSVDRCLRRPINQLIRSLDLDCIRTRWPAHSLGGPALARKHKSGKWAVFSSRPRGITQRKCRYEITIRVFFQENSDIHWMKGIPHHCRRDFHKLFDPREAANRIAKVRQYQLRIV